VEQPPFDDYDGNNNTDKKKFVLMSPLGGRKGRVGEVGFVLISKGGYRQCSASAWTNVTLLRLLTIRRSHHSIPSAWISLLKQTRRRIRAPGGDPLPKFKFK
jgi:hypothetical protein